MAKAKFKIGTLIENKTGLRGVVKAIITRTGGYSYLMVNIPEEIDETEIVAAYRPVVTRKIVKKNSKATKPKGTRTEMSAVTQ